MRVGELIEKLQTVDPDLLVTTVDNEWGITTDAGAWLVRVRNFEAYVDPYIEEVHQYATLKDDDKFVLAISRFGHDSGLL